MGINQKGSKNGIVRRKERLQSHDEARISIYTMLIIALAAVIQCPRTWRVATTGRRLANIDGTCCIDLTFTGTGEIKAPNIEHRVFLYRVVAQLLPVLM